MNTEQERAAFEEWYASSHESYDTTFIYYTPENRYQRPSVDESWSAYQAGRASLQSQDAERLQAAARDIFARASGIEILYGTNKETEGLVMAAIRLANMQGLPESTP